MLRSHDEDLGAISCAGTLALDLPPGVAVVGGRRTLTADIGYALQPAADGSGDVLTLTNADAIITPLATLARVGSPTGDPLAPGAGGRAGRRRSPIRPTIRRPARRQPAAPAAAGRAAPTANPSFNCGNARTRGEIAVCNDAGLAGARPADGQPVHRALCRAPTPSERALLQRTRDRFLSYRDRAAPTPASPTPIAAGCARFRTSWPAAGRGVAASPRVACADGRYPLAIALAMGAMMRLESPGHVGDRRARGAVAAASPPARRRPHPHRAAPPACAGPEHRQFDFWVGHWDVYPTGKRKLVAHSLIEKLYAGCAIRENWMPLGGNARRQPQQLRRRADKRWHRPGVQFVQCAGRVRRRPGRRQDGADRLLARGQRPGPGRARCG